MKDAPLAEMIRSALRRTGKTQAKFIKSDLKKHQLQASEFSDILNAKRPASLDLVVEMADVLEIPLELAVLAREVTECQRLQKKGYESDTENLKRALAVLDDLLEASRARNRIPREFVSLEDFPFGSEPWCVISGDRRETEPDGLGDLLAMSVSSSDLMFLPSLQLPAGSVVRSDKIMRLSSSLDQADSLKSNLLVIGSPAVSLATRAILRTTGATFSFNINPTTFETEEDICNQISDSDRHNPAVLSQIEENEENRIRQMLADYRKPGFIDPIEFNGIRGRSTPRTADYGVVALAPNPWSEDHIVCICAGVHGPGTAGALQMLTMRDKFETHPWGGIFEVKVPDQAPWEERFDYLSPTWDTAPYQPDTYLDHLNKMIDCVNANDPRFSDVMASDETLKIVRTFAERLQSNS